MLDSIFKISNILFTVFFYKEAESWIKNNTKCDDEVLNDFNLNMKSSS